LGSPDWKAQEIKLTFDQFERVAKPITIRHQDALQIAANYLDDHNLRSPYGVGDIGGPSSAWTRLMNSEVGDATDDGQFFATSVWVGKQIKFQLFRKVSDRNWKTTDLPVNGRMWLVRLWEHFLAVGSFDERGRKVLNIFSYSKTGSRKVLTTNADMLVLPTLAH
jgi:hypothetical protein